MEIRNALIQDLEILKRFEQGVIDYERPFAPHLREGSISYYDLEDLILREDAMVAVATINEKIVGSGYALIKNSKPYYKSTHYVYLGFMYVAPEYRGKGVNGKIIKTLMEWSKEIGISEIQLDVYSENKSALKAYKKIGFKPDLVKMRLNLKDN